MLASSRGARSSSDDRENEDLWFVFFVFLGERGPRERESFERERVSDRERERTKIVLRVLRVLRVLGKEMGERERESSIERERMKVVVGRRWWGEGVL